MRIDYAIPLPVAGGRTGTRIISLGDDALKEYITGYRPDVSVDTQIVAKPRSQWKDGFSRFNAEASIPWQVTRSLGDYMSARAFVDSHQLDLLSNPAGSLFVTQSGPSGAGGIQWRVALLQRCTLVSQDGALIVIQYQFWCSNLTTSQT